MLWSAPFPREKLQRCRSLSDLAAVFGSARGPVFEDPAVARLYDALVSHGRAAMVRGCVTDFQEVIGIPTAGSRFVELGSGSGLILLGLAESYSRTGCSFVGLDPSSEMTRIANEHLASSSAAAKTRFMRGTLRKREIAARVGTIDYLILRNVLSWMEDGEAEIRAAVRRLRPGGRILVRELRADAHPPLLKARILDCLSFRVGGVTLSYPPAAMVAAYRNAWTVTKLSSVLRRSGVLVDKVRPGGKDNRRTEPWGVDMFVSGVKRR